MACCWLLGTWVVLALLLTSGGQCATPSMTVLGVGAPELGPLVEALDSSYSFVKASVNVGYTGAGSSSETLLSRVSSGLYDFAVLGSRLPPSSVSNTTTTSSSNNSSWTQLPVAAYGLVPVINQQPPGPSSPWNTEILMSMSLLTSLWSGNISSWQDPTFDFSIVPMGNVTLVVQSYDDAEQEFASATGAFARALCLVDPYYFCGAYRAHGSMLAPTMQALNPGRTVVMPVGSTWAQLGVEFNATGASLAVLPWPVASAQWLTTIQMSNQQGNVQAQPQPSFLLSAVEDFASGLTAGDSLGIDIANGPGFNSWPLSSLIYVVLPSSSYPRGCSYLQALAEFLSWSMTNNAAVSSISTSGDYSQLSAALSYLSASTLSSVQCNDQSIITSSLLTSSGFSSLLLVNWATAYDPTGSSIQLLYTTATSDNTSALSAQGGGIDFAFSHTYVNASTDAPNMMSLPVAAEAVVAAYNVPGLAADASLTLTADLMASILLGEVLTWNDSAIQALNPGLALPNHTIVVVLDKGGDPLASGGPAGGPVNQLLASWLSTRVTGFHAQVYKGSAITYPVESLASHSVQAGDAGVSSVLASTSYAIGWDGFSQVLDQRVLSVALYTYTSSASASSSSSSSGRRATTTITAGSDSILAAVQSAYSMTNNDSSSLSAAVLDASGAWPMVRWSFVYLNATGQVDGCAKMSSLLDWLYWTQTSSTSSPQDIAYGEGAVPFVSGDAVRSSAFVSALASMRCAQSTVFSLQGCVATGGTICSGQGLCQTSSNSTASCRCDSGWSGTYCQVAVGSPSSSSDTLALALGLGLGLGSIVFLLLLAFLILICLLAWLLLSRRKKREDWEINIGEIILDEHLGSGGYGEVYKARWRSTEVAVKIMEESEGAFGEEKRRVLYNEMKKMSALRHPHIVLFMAACVRPPRMCIVMELMDLGSLYDLLHNELIADIPFRLKADIIRQIALGMHCLHSNGIVHRDLKSTNVLLDKKWKAKISDFGITASLAQLRNGQGVGNETGTVPWMAPELLNEETGIDYILTDVYAFGVVMWEVLTREQPYAGISPATVAVSVIKNPEYRPHIVGSDQYAEVYLQGESADLERCVEQLVTLIESCWHWDPVVRPTFEEINTRLASLVDDAKDIGASSSSAGTGSDSFRVRRHGDYSSSSSVDSSAPAGAGRGGARMATRYEGAHAVVYSDVALAGTLWDDSPECMRDALVLHNSILRNQLLRHGGYETMLPKEQGTGQGTFCMAFRTVQDAVLWCADVQRELLGADWPADLLTHRAAQELNAGGVSDRLIFRGLRVRMSIHHGQPQVLFNRVTERHEYVGPLVHRLLGMTMRADGGVVLLSPEAFGQLSQDAKTTRDALLQAGRIRPLYDAAMQDGGHDGEEQLRFLYELLPLGLEERRSRTKVKDALPLSRAAIDPAVLVRGRTSSTQQQEGYTGEDSNQQGEQDDDLWFADPLLGEQGWVRKSYNPFEDARDEGAAMGDSQRYGVDKRQAKELGVLMSSDMSSTIIDYKSLVMGAKPIGQGSFGRVYKAKWKGAEVAVKLLPHSKKRLAEREMLDFRYEAALMAKLNHPNVITFIGACPRLPDLAIVIEYMSRGSLHDVIHRLSDKLPWATRLTILRGAANGIDYLHSLQPPIIHRDLKPSNLLVDADWNVKVADFGLAKIRETNATMTRCGTAAWTAPEVLLGNSYDEKADVYSFGIIMWELLTREKPYSNLSFMRITQAVLKGERPSPVPKDCPAEYAEVMRRCWDQDPRKRPVISKVAEAIDAMLNREDRAESMFKLV